MRQAITGSTRTTEYLFTDHLGSVDVITHASGSVVQSLAFDAFGRRRDAVDYDAFTDPMLFAFDTSKTTRGFTFHEALDPVGLIHMNGRVYDPTLGRFLSPDPFVQDPGNTQSLNRYSYVFNNPLSYTDPSGYVSLKDDVLRKTLYFVVKAVSTFCGEAASACEQAGNALVDQAIAASQSNRGAANSAYGNGAPSSGGFRTGRSSVVDQILADCAAKYQCVFATDPDSDATADATLGGTGSRETGGKFENGVRTQTYLRLLAKLPYLRVPVPGSRPDVVPYGDTRTVGDVPDVVEGNLWDLVNVLARRYPPPKSIAEILAREIESAAAKVIVDELETDETLFRIRVGTQRVRVLQKARVFVETHEVIYDPYNTGSYLLVKPDSILWIQSDEVDVLRLEEVRDVWEVCAFGGCPLGNIAEVE